MIGHAVLLVVMARGWFFTGDDWEYLTRDGLGNIFEPHMDTSRRSWLGWG